MDKSGNHRVQMKFLTPSQKLLSIKLCYHQKVSLAYPFEVMMYELGH